MVKIATSGINTGSPYENRRKFYIEIEAAGNYFTVLPYMSVYAMAYDILTEFKELLQAAIPGKLPHFLEYVSSFCKYCVYDRERDIIRLCLRHQSIINMPIGNTSNNYYSYIFHIVKRPEKPTIVKLHYLIGTGWQIDGAITVDKWDNNVIRGAIRAIRPSGVVFTYRLRPGKPSSAAYIISQTINFINNITQCLDETSSKPSYCKWWYIYPKIFVQMR